MKRWYRKRQGFTIVELLIVIVVIAILAAITTVAYTGVTNRAEDTKTTAAVSEWIKKLIAYATEVGDYPYAGDPNQTQPYSATPTTIGHNYPCLGLYPDDICANITNSGVIGNGHTFVDEEFNQYILDRYGGSLPQPSQKDITINGEPHRGAFIAMVGYATGANAAGNGPGIVFYLTGGTCPSSLAGRPIAQSAGTTGGIRCNVSMPDFR